ncbi:MAG: hypothetical protein MZU95_01240 [Desulfomicrobium escambiense]|nr:hypothetical protein [Desulfomicrobium escambiense]
MSIPAVFGPVEIGPQLLVDGGVLNNVPADVVRNLGAATVIAVRVRGGRVGGRGERRRRRSSPSPRAPSTRWKGLRNGSGWRPPTS